MRPFVILGLFCAVPMGATAEGISVNGTLNSIGYADARGFGLPAPAREIQGQLGLEGAYSLGSATLSFDLTAYAPEKRAGFVDGRIGLDGSAGKVRWSIGLLREAWGRSDESRLNILSAPNLVYGLASTQTRVAQPGARIQIPFGENVRLEIVALGDVRLGPQPAAGDRFSFGMPVQTAVEQGNMGQGAVAARLFGSSSRIDWGVHVFHGIAREPSYVATTLGTVTAHYDEISQIGYELEVSPGDWRLWSEGFWRENGRTKFGDRQDFGHAMLGAEYQFFAAFGGSHDIILGGQYLYDSRGSKADAPFQNAVVLGAKFLQSEQGGWDVEVTTAYDLDSKGRGDRLSVTKELSETPFVEFDFSVVNVTPGEAGTVLDVFGDDSSISSAINWKF